MALLVLVALLGHSNYKVRDVATKALSPPPPILVSTLITLEQEGCPEVKTRSKYLLGLYYDHYADRLSKEIGKMPWISWCCDGCPPPLQADLLFQARKTTKGGGPEWEDYREATRLLLARRIAARQPYLDVLQQLWDEELNWRKANGYKAH